VAGNAAAIAAAAAAAAADHIHRAAKYVLVPEKLNSQHRCVIVMLTLLLSCDCPSMIFFRNTLQIHFKHMFI